MMKITAICLTYRRPELLEEAVQSFLMQDYAGPKELIIVNDEPEQTLVFKHAQVRVLNLLHRMPDLPTKYNCGVSEATGELIVPWDDDDIFLSHRLSTIAHGARNGAWYSDYLYTDDAEGGLTLTEGKIHCNHAYNQKLFMKLGAYHDHAELAFDFVLMNRLRAVVSDMGADNVKPSYIYRKHSTAGRNYSSMFHPDSAVVCNSFAAEHAEFEKGTVVLNPRWSRDWQTAADEVLRGRPEPVALHEVDKDYKKPADGQA